MFLKFLVVVVLHDLPHIVVNFVFYPENVVVRQVLRAKQLLVRGLDQLFLLEVILRFVCLLTLRDKLSLIFILGQPSVFKPGVGTTIILASTCFGFGLGTRSVHLPVVFFDQLVPSGLLVIIEKAKFKIVDFFFLVEIDFVENEPVVRQR